jgi:hypothetical protein
MYIFYEYLMLSTIFLRKSLLGRVGWLAGWMRLLCAALFTQEMIHFGFDSDERGFRGGPSSDLCVTQKGCVREDKRQLGWGWIFDYNPKRMETFCV